MITFPYISPSASIFESPASEIWPQAPKMMDKVTINLPVMGAASIPRIRRPLVELLLIFPRTVMLPVVDEIILKGKY